MTPRGSFYRPFSLAISASLHVDCLWSPLSGYLLPTSAAERLKHCSQQLNRSEWVSLRLPRPCGSSTSNTACLLPLGLHVSLRSSAMSTYSPLKILLTSFGGGNTPVPVSFSLPSALSAVAPPPNLLHPTLCLQTW